MDGSDGLFLILMVSALYLVPTLIALLRGVSDGNTVPVLNVFLGWTFTGWVVSFARAWGLR